MDNNTVTLKLKKVCSQSVRFDSEAPNKVVQNVYMHTDHYALLGNPAEIKVNITAA